MIMFLYWLSKVLYFKILHSGNLYSVSELFEHVLHLNISEPASVKYELSSAQITALTWNIAQFVIELGHKQTGEAILVALESRLTKVGSPACD